MGSGLSRLKLILKASRPLGWPILPIAFLVGLLQSGADMGILSFVQFTFLSFPYCLFLYGVNDAYDYESDRLNPRKDSLEGAMVGPENRDLVTSSAAAGALLLMISSFLTFNLENIAATSLLLLFSYAYSAPPARLKERPPLDSASNGVIYVLAPAAMGFSFGSGVFPVKAYFVALCAMGVHAFASIMDYSVDKKVGDRTVAVGFGKRAAALFAFAVFTLTLLFAGIETWFVLAYIVACDAFFLAVALHPSERLARLLFKFVLAGFLVVSVAYSFMSIINI